MYSSETFGRIFWVDDDFEFRSCPLCIDGTGDFEMEDYVSEWQDWEGVDMNLLLGIHRCELLNKTQYSGSLTHREAPVVDTFTEKDTMTNYNWNPSFYKELVKDYNYRFPKFMEISYPNHTEEDVNK